jgi:ArsR family transcriptional regulator
MTLFHALAEPSRVRILALLRSMELAVGEIAQVLGQSQPRVSHHVRVLDEAGLIERRKEGSWVYLRLTEAAEPELLFALVDRWLDADAEAQMAADGARLDAIRAERAEAARR